MASPFDHLVAPLKNQEMEVVFEKLALSLAITVVLGVLGFLRNNQQHFFIPELPAPLLLSFYGLHRGSLREDLGYWRKGGQTQNGAGVLSQALGLANWWGYGQGYDLLIDDNSLMGTIS